MNHISGFRHCTYGSISLILVHLLLFYVPTSDAGQPGPVDLWKSADEWAGTVIRSPQAVGALPVKVDVKQLWSSHKSFSLTLPSKERITVVRKGEVERPAKGMLIWRGTVEDDKDSAVTFYAEKDELLGTITSKGKVYGVKYLDKGFHLIEEFDRGGLRPDDKPLLPRIPPKSQDEHLLLKKQATSKTGENWRFMRAGNATFPRPRPGTSCPEDKGGRIDVLVVYTEGARQEARSDNKVKARIRDAVRETNESFSNSKVSARIKLVYVGKYELETDPELQQSIQTDLTTFTGDLRQGNADGTEASRIHALRLDYRADIVLLITGPRVNPSEACGLSYEMDAPTPVQSASAFGVVRWDCMDPHWQYSFAHELGHIMGAGHSDGSSNVVYCDNKGYVEPEPSIPGARRWGTIMATQGERIPYWSNPNVSYKGKPTGATGVHGADNHRTLNETADLVANFMPSCGYPGKRKK